MSYEPFDKGRTRICSLSQTRILILLKPAVRNWTRSANGKVLRGEVMLIGSS